MPMCWSDPAVASATGPTKADIDSPSIEDEQFLLRAFRSFAEAAGSLERSYASLRGEVERLRRELERANSDLAESLEKNRSVRAYLDQILESLPCGVLVVSPDGEITKTNPEAGRLLGTDLPAVGPASAASLPDSVRRLLESAREEGIESEIGLPGDSGSVRWLAARHALITDGTSIFILRDISERKHLEETKAAARRDQALAEMAAVLAHEIRNPLGSLELFAGLLSEAQLDGECRQWVEHLQAGLRTLAATVNNVLHFHSMPPRECAPVDLGRLLEWVRDFCRPLARRSGITLSLQNRVSGLMLPADRHRLEQVLLNLVLNSVRSMPAGGWIELMGCETPDGSAVVLAVEDTGDGISEENLPRIFDAGFSTRASSPGLGLAVCRKIVEQHRGTIEARRRGDCGTTFKIVFPLSASPMKEVCP
jgi:two-component system sensor histidine kinase FlrB